MLSLRDMSKRFGSVTALDGCSFAIERGHMLGFLGPNGARKTTTIRAIFGLVELDEDEALWDEQPIGMVQHLRFGYMPEERGLYPRMPVAEQIEYFGRLGVDTADDVRAPRGISCPLGLLIVARVPDMNLVTRAPAPERTARRERDRRQHLSRASRVTFGGRHRAGG